MASRVPESIVFAEEEENVLKFWKEENAFAKCLEQSKGKPRYTFYDGPPFATGLPHYGHILAGTVKDIVTRYAHQQGYHVERRFGWDCHGLPVEYEIDKALGIKGPDDVAKMGIEAYNNECRKIVMRYADEWEKIVGRMGRWIDFKNDYKTLYPWFMETIWWVFKQLYAKGLVYQGVKVMPYSTACTTPLSNFESGQNYKEVIDPCVIITFPILGDAHNASLIGWTTTPWTLPSNMACCVHPELIYVKVMELKSSKYYILMKSRIPFVFKTIENVKIIEEFPGSKLNGQKYEPLFSYFVQHKDTAFRVLLDKYVTEDSGTGVVHQAPYFGEDDYRVCLANNVVTRDQQIICPVDASGRFTEEVIDFKGLYVKDADKEIIALLKAKDRLFQSSQVKHSYPFCWRSDTPLIYKAVPSWFIRVEHMTQQLLDCNSNTYWVPEYVKDKRFGNWLRDARDWAVSRNRYWGTPMPLWVSPTGDEIVCIGSIEELEKYSGVRVTDLHRESIDHIEIPSSTPGKPPLKRVSAVFDCWFESGSMPLAQQHYPFENANNFSNFFPADFIAEGIDQTRGWFYTLLVISTALFNKPPYKNLNVNGLVLASDGQKMSKRKKNYPDPMEVVHKYGADALRLYLINSPVVRAENLRFKEEGVRDIIKDVFLPWFNAYRFFFQNVERIAIENQIEYTYDVNRHTTNRSTNVMDVWIISFKESLLEFIDKEMKAYHLYTVVPRLTKFIHQLTNWYVRLNRKRIKGEFGFEDCQHALDTLFDVLFTMVKMMAPFTPFLTEYMYQRLRVFDSNSPAGSVHYLMMPKPNKNYINLPIERAVARMQSVVDLGRIMRDRRTTPVKYPVLEVVVIHQTQEYLDDIKSLEDFILSELNVRRIVLSSDKSKYGVSMRIEPDFKLLGQRLNKDIKEVQTIAKNMTDDEIAIHLSNGYFDIKGYRIQLNEMRVIFKFDGKEDNSGDKFEAHSDNDVLVLLDMTPDTDLLNEGIAREVINRIQKLKKKAHLIPTDPVTVYYTLDGDAQEIGQIVISYKEFIENIIKSPLKAYNHEAEKKRVIIGELQEYKNITFKLTICSDAELLVPNLPWVNVVNKIQSNHIVTNTSTEGTILLKTGHGEIITYDRLNSEIQNIFALHSRKFMILTDQGNRLNTVELGALTGKTIFIVAEQIVIPEIDTSVVRNSPYCKFVNTMHLNRKSCILTENPKDNNLCVEPGYLKFILHKVYPEVDDVDSKIQLAYSN